MSLEMRRARSLYIHIYIKRNDGVGVVVVVAVVDDGNDDLGRFVFFGGCSVSFKVHPVAR